MKYSLSAIIFLCVLATTGLAQNAPGAGFGIEANVMVGKIYKHTKKFTSPLPDFCTAYEINFQWQTWGKKEWQQRVRFPIWGIGIDYVNYGNDDIYGRAICIYPNLQVPLIRKNKWEWTLRAGFGFGYITKHFSYANDWDTLDVAMSSTLNNYTLFMTDLRYRINKNWDVQAGFNFSHISNGTYHVPNLGINMYGAHIGLRYFPVTSQPVKTIRQLPHLPNRWLLQGRFSSGFTQYGPAFGPTYKIYFATVYASKRWAGKNKVFAGFDYSYHEDIYAFLRDNEIDVGKEAQNSWKAAALGGVEFGVGCFGIIAQVGYYLHDAAVSHAPVYEKIGTHIYLVQKEHGFLKELFLSAMLKTHTTDAEVAEFGFGLGF